MLREGRLGRSPCFCLDFLAWFEWFDERLDPDRFFRPARLPLERPYAHDCAEPFEAEDALTRGRFTAWFDWPWYSLMFPRLSLTSAHAWD